jgi:predicted porin
VAAQAADESLFDSIKDPLPDTLTSHGVTLYGALDVGYAYQTNGAPQNGSLYTGGLNFNMYAAPQNRQSVSALSGNGLEQSKIGLKIEERVGYGLAAIGKIETGFNPFSGELADACASLVNNNGKSIAVRDAGVDGGRCGQAFNGVAYAGVSHPMVTLTVGRQTSLELDSIATYDPMGLSYAFSLIGWSGGAAAGVGSTETARWDNSLKSIFTYGPLHAAVMYAAGSNESSIQNDAYAADIGATYVGFSLDAVYTKENGAVGMSSLGYGAGVGECQPGSVAFACPSNGLNATITDNQAWSIMGKYTFVFDNGGFDVDAPRAKATLFAGYVHIDMANPSGTFAVGARNSGGYEMVTVNNQPFGVGGGKVLQTEWAGAKYETGPWAFTAAYYHLSQDSYVARSLTGALTGSCSGVSHANCSGDTNTVSGLVDYTFSKHFDVYSGVAWSEVSGGLTPRASGGVGTNENTTFMSGLRVKF